MFTLAACYAVLGFIAVILVRRNPAFVAVSAEMDETQLTVKEALGKCQFWVLCMMDFCTIFPLLYMASVFKIMGMQIGNYDDKFLTVVASVGSLANGLLRVFWGYAQDKTGFRRLYQIVLLIELLFCTLMPIIVRTNQYLYLFWVFIGYMCLGAHFVLFPNCIISIFGLRSSVQLSSFIYISRCIPAISTIFISKALVPYFGEATYSIMFYSSSVLVIISSVLLAFVQEEKPIRKESSVKTDEDSYVRIN